MLLEKTYLPVINFVYNKIKRLDVQARKTVLIICIVVESFSTYLYQCDEFMGIVYPASLNAIVGIVAFAGVIIAGIDQRLEEINIKKKPVYLLMVCGAVIFISGIHHFITYSYMIMGFFMCLMMPAFLIVWGSRSDIDVLFKIIAKVSTIFFVVFTAMNCIITPISDPMFSSAGRYFGMASDPNGLAKISVTAAVCTIYMMIVKKGFWRLPYAAVFISALVITFLTASRTNIIAIVLICAATVIFLVKAYILDKHYNIKKIVAVLCAAIVVIVGVVSVYVFDENREASTIEIRLSQGVLEDGSIDFNALSSGRLAIWSYCLSKTTFIGNDMSNGLPNEEYGIHNEHAHNTVIELLYRSGVVAGISFLILELYCAIWVIRRIISDRKNSSAEIIAALLIIAFEVASMFDIVVLPLAKMTTFLFYISLSVVLSKDVITPNGAESEK